MSTSLFICSSSYVSFGSVLSQTQRIHDLNCFVISFIFNFSSYSGMGSCSRAMCHKTLSIKSLTCILTCRIGWDGESKIPSEWSCFQAILYKNAPYLNWVSLLTYTPIKKWINWEVSNSKTIFLLPGFMITNKCWILMFPYLIQNILQ